ncbi:PREDICTED: dnaJ homolog subfamily B member 13-like isoform X1 [Camelina sativa]|uniref:DnaJ homolog subfamily B member 13-like isoform X1 n=1 Tax=Camelina sativa TaxID=90675 RepID=A0ABM0XPN8_CAMSA|nr:PREDICTED: dnaJ homolog subfamily B member 13-like isoform X1 [Camelina sativa]XP_010489022.1 PREDICTED: dnaJ homolog subfamily B member 13-like isoform X2 [Camelina sativa]XP_019097044.1 PREDICTED: dnaJ homolog subfamily B member 13-like isoform X1 [Camelina sativa]
MSHPRSEDDIFAEFFGASIPSGPRNADGIYADYFGASSPSAPRREADIYTEFFGVSSPSAAAAAGDSSKGGDGGDGSLHHGGARKAAPIEKKLPCSLEHLYKGTTKKMKISREIADVIGKTMQVEEILTVDVKLGWKKGTKITFPEKGNKQPGVIPADLVFIIDEKPHPVFTREGNDLVVTLKISVLEAFTGYTINLTTLDGRRLTIPVNCVIHPEYEEVVPMEGMPLQKDQTKKGNLRIKFNIKFPTSLTSEQKIGLKKLLE